MQEDKVVNAYFSDNARFADLISGLVFGGRQVVREEELEERDSQTGIWQIWDQAGGGKKRYRDLLRRAPFGVSFAIMGLENQKEVFDFIRCSGDKEKLEELVKGNLAYQEMEDDAYMVAVKYSNNKEMLGIKSDYKIEKGRKRNLCKAILDMIEEGREEGRAEAREEMREEKIQIISQMIKEDMDKVLIQRITKCTEEEYTKASLI